MTEPAQRSGERDDYSGPFDADFRYEDLSKEALVKLVREFALIAHLLDRPIFTAIGMKYEVVDEKHGYFELAHCGALMDVEPFGDRSVIGMCHHIEDPTFDTTATAINPKARCRPVHRPPRSSTDQLPHCRWEVVIDDDAEPLEEPEIARVVRGTTAASHEWQPIGAPRPRK